MHVNWRKSTYSLSNGNCVEVGTGQGTVAVRHPAQVRRLGAVRDVAGNRDGGGALTARGPGADQQ